MLTPLPRRPLCALTTLTAFTALAALTTATACGSKDAPAPSPSASTSAPLSTNTAPSPALPDAAPSPLFVALESKEPVAFSGLTGGIWVGNAALGRSAQALSAGGLVEAPMPSGLPEGPGHIVRAAGRLPNALWLSFEQERPDGKPGLSPLFRLGKGSFSRFAEDWTPAITAWSKNRLLAASTSSGRLKLKVIEPQLKDPPADIPAARFDNEPCLQSLKLRQIAALPSGEVFAAGNCSDEEGSKTPHYVVIRWASPDAAAGTDASTAKATAPLAASPSAAAAGVGATPLPSATPTPSAAVARNAAPAASGAAAASAGTATSAAAASAGTTASAAPPAAPSVNAAASAGANAGGEASIGIAGTLFVIPGSDRNLAHRALFVRSATEAYAVAADEGRHTSHLARFDGTTWSVEALPPTTEMIQALSGTSDGTLWLVSEHQIWKRPASGTWEQVPLPNRAFPEPEPSWQLSDVFAIGDDVWLAARHASKSASRHVVLSTKQPSASLQWR